MTGEEIMTMDATSIVLAADLGGTNIRMAAIERTGNIIDRIENRTPRSDDDSAIINVLADMHSQLSQKLASKPLGVGIAAASIIDPVNQILTSSPNIPELNGSYLPHRLAELIETTVHLENDATAAAIGEGWIGASRGVGSSICITLGTGIGGGIIIDGNVIRGIDGTAGEIGHVVVEHKGHPCGCGNFGCIEQYASATALVRIANEELQNYPGSILASNGRFDAKDIYDAAVKGDECAKRVFAKMTSYLGDTIVGLVNIFNPEMIVIGGGLASGWDMFGDRLCEYVDKMAFRRPAERVRILPAELGSDAGVLGAAKAVFDLAV